MNNKKAKSVLPKDLLDEVQKYIQGEYLYIPKASGSRKKWGEKTGTRQEIVQRNQTIRYEFNQGKSIEQLSEEFYLAINTIKKIVYTKIKK